MSDYGIGLSEQHAALLGASAITPEVAHERGYVSVTEHTMLRRHGYAKAVPVPGLLIPRHLTDGRSDGWQYRPDEPRVLSGGKVRKYETPWKQSVRLDVHPRAQAQLDDPKTPLWITEGARKADAAVSVGLCCISLQGVDCWRGTNSEGGKTALADWHDVALVHREVILAFDSDVVRKPEVTKALRDLTGYLTFKKARVRFCHLPDDDATKCGLDDFLAAHSLEELLGLVHEEAPRPRQPELPVASPRSPAVPRTLPETIDTYRRWLVLDSPPLSVYATLGTYAANLLAGDPVWLMLIGGSGSGKTELLHSLKELDGVAFRSTLSGEAALLSGVAKKDSAIDASGGLLREVGEHGVLVLKDFTSILAMNRDTRAILLAALREVYDGHWSRQVGTEGGRTLTWHGKLGLVAGCTSAYDGAHGVQALMGERFLLCRIADASHDHDDRQAVAALAQAGRENGMRSQLADAVRGLYRNTLPVPDPLTSAEQQRLVGVAQLAVAARSPVERDYHGEIALVGDREAPTRFVKSLERLWSGLSAIGLDRDEGWQVIAKVAFDSIPKLRRAVIDSLAADELVNTSTVAGRVRHPPRSTRRALEDLHAHGVLVKESGGGKGKADSWGLEGWAETRRALLVWGGSDIPGKPPAVAPLPEMSEPRDTCTECGEPMKPDGYCPVCDV